MTYNPITAAVPQTITAVIITAAAILQNAIRQVTDPVKTQDVVNAS